MKHDVEMRNLRAELRKQLEEQKAVLTKGFDDQTAALMKGFDDQKAQLDTQHQQQVEHTLGVHQGTVDAMKEQHELQMATLTKEMEDLKKLYQQEQQQTRLLITHEGKKTREETVQHLDANLRENMTALSAALGKRNRAAANLDENMNDRLEKAAKLAECCSEIVGCLHSQMNDMKDEHANMQTMMGAISKCVDSCSDIASMNLECNQGIKAQFKDGVKELKAANKIMQGSNGALIRETRKCTNLVIQQVQKAEWRTTQEVRREGHETRTVTRELATNLCAMTQEQQQQVKELFDKLEGSINCVANEQRAHLAEQRRQEMCKNFLATEKMCKNGHCTTGNGTYVEGLCDLCLEPLMAKQQCTKCGGQQAKAEGCREGGECNMEDMKVPVSDTPLADACRKQSPEHLLANQIILAEGSQNRLLVALGVEHKCAICLKDLDNTNKQMMPLHNLCDSWQHVVCQQCEMSLQRHHKPHNGNMKLRCPICKQTAERVSDGRDTVYTALLAIQDQFGMTIRQPEGNDQSTASASTASASASTALGHGARATIANSTPVQQPLASESRHSSACEQARPNQPRLDRPTCPSHAWGEASLAKGADPHGGWKRRKS